LVSSSVGTLGDGRYELIDGLRLKMTLYGYAKSTTSKIMTSVLMDGGVLPEGHIDINLAQFLNPFVTEAIQRVLCFLQVFLFKTHARKTLLG
jgi:hypothetical protein